DVRKVGLAAADDDALELVGERRGGVGRAVAVAVDGEAGDLWRERDPPGGAVVGDVGGLGVDAQPAHHALLAVVVALLAARAREREEARDVEAVAVAVDGEAARLEVAVAVGADAAAAGQVDVAEDPRA